jgi:hypothetical protein
VEDAANTAAPPKTAKIHSPRLARREDAADFKLEVREIGEIRERCTLPC